MALVPSQVLARVYTFLVFAKTNKKKKTDTTKYYTSKTHPNCTVAKLIDRSSSPWCRSLSGAVKKRVKNGGAKSVLHTPPPWRHSMSSFSVRSSSCLEQRPHTHTTSSLRCVRSRVASWLRGVYLTLANTVEYYWYTRFPVLNALLAKHLNHHEERDKVLRSSKHHNSKICSFSLSLSQNKKTQILPLVFGAVKTFRSNCSYLSYLRFCATVLNRAQSSRARVH